VNNLPCRRHYYLHMPIGKVWIYRLLFVCLFFLCVCMDTDFAQDKASVIQFCRVFPRQGISHFGELCSPKSPNGRNHMVRMLADLSNRDATFVEYHAACGRRIGMCGYTAFLDDVHTCMDVE